MQDLMSLTGKTRFCPALPGDSASSRRLSEIFLAGCIPVQAPSSLQSSVYLQHFSFVEEMQRAHVIIETPHDCLGGCWTPKVIVSH